MPGWTPLVPREAAVGPCRVGGVPLPWGTGLPGVGGALNTAPMSRQLLVLPAFLNCHTGKVINLPAHQEPRLSKGMLARKVRKILVPQAERLKRYIAK